jgi:diphthamide synthase (EF-2-diphthine--ammonia ligase)
MIDGPVFRKKIKIVESGVVEESRINATLIIKKAELIDKD